MLSSVLRSTRAITINVEIMRSFVKYRVMLAGNEDLSKQLKKLDNKINNVFRFLLKKIDSLHQQEIAVHSIDKGKGRYITREEHKPPNKQRKSREYYQEKTNQSGPSALLFMTTAQECKPRHWYDMISGIISLTKVYEVQAVDMTCQRALEYGAISYQTVKTILEKGLSELPIEDLSLSEMGGYGHELSIYDNIK